MEQIKKYGLPWLINYGWEIAGRVIIAIGLLGLAAMQSGPRWP